MAADLKTFLQNESVASEFKPYCELSREADALTVYFKPDRDYSKRLTDHVTLFLGVDTNELVGCRIKGISGILEDLPNDLRIDHGGVKLSVIFWSFRGGVKDEEVRKILNELTEAGRGMELSPSLA
jgi:hypothetical protein